MAKISWNVFVDKYQTPIGFMAPVSPSLPKGMIFDKNMKKLPTPYGLFQEWASQNLLEDWASTKVPGGFIICVINLSDSNAIVSKFKTIGNAKNIADSINSTKIGYKDSMYALLAKHLGYSL